MNGNVRFMLNLRYLFLALNSDRKLTSALELKELLINNIEHLPDSDTTIAFIDSLFVLCEEFSSPAVGVFYTSACDFYEYIMDINPKDVFFIGKESAYVDFTARIKHANYNISFYNSDHLIDLEILNESVSNSRFSILAYDFHGSKALLNKGLCRPFAHFYYEKPQAYKCKIYDDWTVFLQYQYKRLMEGMHDQVILGSSYSYHTLTDVNSVNSLSFSLPGLDITSAMMFYSEKNKIQSMNNTIFCFGVYDFFKEIKKGNAQVYVYAYKAVMAFSNAKSVHPELRLRCSPVSHDLAASVDLIVGSRYLYCNDSGSEGELTDEHDILSRLQEGIYYPVREPKCDDKLLGAQVVSLHNKYIKYENSFELNCELINKLKKNADRLCKKVYFIIPPLPESYVENISESMKNRVYDFLSELKSEFFHVRDYSIDRDFYYSDFYDGHHLNEHGAKKLRNKLYNEKILNSEVL
ncbi:hypothetical protein MUU47_17835 [Scandinavium sp. H11S7]|uniref:Uncharacterized protein n=1 Tax=Scandinavium hiltneri TaxID=2926519 RepID=A0ABT2E4Z4_9ENTR|nr:hypothetical protein [Scandinavium hiltneri]MCS2162949.1 hypothetical protein [Scandinavium hiltneri]